MAINVNQLTEQLRMMPDQALQRMAQMYKQDPYIFPMVISEDMARKKLRASAQAQAAQPQPKVADQALMAMAPQPQPAPGIAGLQAPNIQNMADGGIAGYDDVFDAAGESVVRMSDGGVARYQDQGLVQTTADTLSQVQAPAMAQLQTLKTQLMEAERVLAAAAKSGDAQSVTQYAQAVQQLRDQINAVAERSFGNRAQQVVSDIRTPPSKTDILAAYGPGADRMPQVQTPPAQGKPSAAPGAAPGAPARAAAQPSVESAKLTAAQFLDKEDIERQAKEYEMAEVTAVDAARRRRQKMLDERQGKAYEGLEALLKKEEEGAKGELDQSKAMAIFNAGLAMMSGTSPRALENIGKGAMVGTGQYAEALKDFKKAAKERQRAMADIEQARRAEARADEEAQLKFEERADDKMSNARKYVIDAGVNLGLKRADIARQIHTTQVEQQGAMERARMQLNAPPAQLQTFEALGRAMGAKDRDSAIRTGFELSTREQRLPALYDQYIARANSQKISMKGGGTEGEEFLKQYPTFETYLRGMGVQAGATVGQTGGGGFVKPPEGAPILR